MTLVERQPAATSDNMASALWRSPPLRRVAARPDRAPPARQQCPLMRAQAQRVIACTRDAWAAQQMLWC